MFGLFGGVASHFSLASDLVSDGLDDVYHLQGRETAWKWQNTDLAVRTWYVDVGHNIPFDVLHVIQWDLLLFESLAKLYGRVSPDALGFSGLTPVELIASRWHWTLNQPHIDEWKRLLPLVAARFGYTGVPHACLGPGYTLPRAFLERYAETEIPELAHDELRLPLFGQIFGFQLIDVGFYPKWFDQEADQLFNANGGELDTTAVRAELTRPGGRRAFHPCRESFSPGEVEEFLTLLSYETRREES